MAESLRDRLKRCQILLEEGDYDRMIDLLKEVREEDFSGIDLEEAKELLSMLTFLIEKAEAKRGEVAKKLVNFQRFRGYIQGA